MSDSLLTAYSPPPKAKVPLPTSVRNELLMGPEDRGEAAVTKHIPRVSSQIWSTILKSQTSKPSSSAQSILSPIVDPPLNSTAISRVSSAKAAALHRPAETEPASKPSRQPFSRVLSAAAGPSNLLHNMNTSDSARRPAGNRGVFTGKRVYAAGAANCLGLRQPLMDNGAIWLDHNDDLASADFVLVRLAESAIIWQQNQDEQIRSRMRTECWVEQCLHDDRMCAPNEHMTFTPLRVMLPLNGEHY
jgi:hypothetical protein